MYSIQLDENDYFTGSYAKIGTVVGGANVSSLPPDMTRSTCYKLVGDSWVFDDNKWASTQADNTLADIRRQRNQAFTLVDKYQLTLTYSSLAPQQRGELAVYRQAWLDAPETQMIPEKPEWMI